MHRRVDSYPLFIGRRTTVLSLAVLGSLCICIIAQPLAVFAAPYTVRDIEHPFDPDWPDVYLIFATKCVACHRPGTTNSNLISYEAAVAAKTAKGQPIIVPGRPEASALWRQIAWNHLSQPGSTLPAEPRMPEAPEDWLTGEQLAAVRRWITRGALEYKLPGTGHRPKVGPTRPLLEIDFPSAKECKVCHPKQYREWSRSMHAYAMHSPVMEAFNLSIVERTSGTIGTFCTRCHTPLGTALGENGSRRNVNRSRLSMEGVTCVVCHRQARPYYKANVRHALVPGQLLKTCMYGPFTDTASQAGHTHPAAGSAHLKTSAFCGSCHDVTNPEGFRLEEAYSEWQNSPAAKQGITCQQCHMGPIPGVPIADDQRPLGMLPSSPASTPSCFRCDRCRIIPSPVPTTRCCPTPSSPKNSTGCTRSITAITRICRLIIAKRSINFAAGIGVNSKSPATNALNC